MEITGKLLEKSEIQQVTDTFKKQEFVIEYIENPQYPEYLKFQSIQDKCGQIDNFEIGSEIKVSFNLKGRKWTDPNGQIKYFNTLQAWRLEVASENTPNPNPAPPIAETGAYDTQKEPESQKKPDVQQTIADDDLPF